MPRKSDPEKPFDSTAYKSDWDKKNMAFVGSKYKREFVEEFRESLKVLGKKQSDIIREAMEAVRSEAQKNGRGS